MASKATQTSVADVASSTELIAANPDRTGLLIANTSVNALFILLGSGTATETTAFSWRLAQNEQVNLSDISGRCWKGAVQGIWSADGSGAANITELE